MAKRIYDLRHILGFLLAPALGCAFVAVAAYIGLRITGAGFFRGVAYVAISEGVWAYCGILLVALPLHARFLKRKSYGYWKYATIAALLGAVMSAFPVPLSPLEPRPLIAPFELIGVWAIPVSAIVGVAIVSAFWLIVMWRNGFYPPVKRSVVADTSAATDQ